MSDQMKSREELLDELYDLEELHRPPIEHKSALLELTRGCSWGKCAFCDFPRDGFSVLDLAEVGRKTALLAEIIGDRHRLHLTGCDPFCLPVSHIEQALSRIRSSLPSVREISMYARADEIERRSDDELASLRANGLTDLHVGLESGSPKILEMHSKGESPEMMRRALSRLARVGISYHLSVIPGLGGRALSDEHADMTADALSRLAPVSIWCIALKIWPGTPLAEMADRGSFIPMTWREILIEERRMIARMEMRMPCIYVDSTVLGKYTLAVPLPDGKQWALDNIDKILAEEDERR